MSDPTIWASIISAVGSGVASSNIPMSFQPKRSFDSDPYTSPPTQLLRAQTGLQQVLGAQATRLASPTSLPDAVVGDMPSFSGGGLPMDIGVGGTPSRLKTPYILPGIDLPSANGRPSVFDQPGLGGRHPGSPDPGDPTAPVPRPGDPTKPGVPGIPGGKPPATDVPNPGDPPDARHPPREAPRSVLSRVTDTLSGGDGSAGGTGDVMQWAQSNPQTYGALQLLLHAARGTT